VRGAPPLAAIATLEEAGTLLNTTDAAALVMRAHANNPIYTGWYLTQAGTLPALRDMPEIATLAERARAEIARMSARAR
jgi:hypothetical protein